MFKRVTILVAITLFLGISINLSAHSPSDIEMNFDNETEMINVKVMHQVQSVDKHFVEKIEVYLNDTLSIVQHFRRQEENEYQKAGYMMFEAEIEDRITVKAYCSIHGMRSQELIIEAPAEEQEK